MSIKGTKYKQTIYQRIRMYEKHLYKIYILSINSILQNLQSTETVLY